MNKQNKTKKTVNGENILYHYIQKNILDAGELSEFQKQLIEHFIIDLSIWIPENLFKINPVLLPFVVRDASCRKKNPRTGKHEWGMANEQGFLRDDNSLIKGIFKTCLIQSPEIKQYDNHYLGNGFVACHIWREINNTSSLASTLPITNSFIPNLVWLPNQISKLTDREKSYAQCLLQSISYQLYHSVNDDEYTQEIWSYLPNPKIESRVGFSKLNFFNITDDWIQKRITKLDNELQNILNTVNDDPITLKKVKCSTYLPTLKEQLLESQKDSFTTWITRSQQRIKSNITMGSTRCLRFAQTHVNPVVM